MTSVQATPTAIQPLPFSWLHFHELHDTALVDIPCGMFIIGQCRASIYRAFDDGTLTRIKVGGSTRIRVSELRTMIGLVPQGLTQ